MATLAIVPTQAWYAQNPPLPGVTNTETFARGLNITTSNFVTMQKVLFDQYLSLHRASQEHRKASKHSPMFFFLERAYDQMAPVHVNVDVPTEWYIRALSAVAIRCGEIFQQFLRLGYISDDLERTEALTGVFWTERKAAGAKRHRAGLDTTSSKRAKTHHEASIDHPSKRKRDETASQQDRPHKLARMGSSELQNDSRPPSSGKRKFDAVEDDSCEDGIDHSHKRTKAI